MAVNPLPFLANMPDPGQAFLQAFNQARAQRDQKIAQQSRQAQYAQWIERLKVDRSPPTLMEFNLAFPEMADAIKKAFEPLDEASKQARLGYATQALSALERGDAETAKTMANELYTAAKNTPGQEQFAEELKFGIELMDTKPDILKVGLSNGIFNGDQKRYEAFFASKNGELTGFQKDLIAANIDPTSEEGRAKAKEFVSLKIDPIVQMPTPDGAQFIGRQSEYNRRFGGGSVPGDKIPSPMTKAQYDALPPGTEYYDPRDKRMKRKGAGKGGASSNASGGFRAEGGPR